MDKPPLGTLPWIKSFATIVCLFSLLSTAQLFAQTTIFPPAPGAAPAGAAPVAPTPPTTVAPGGVQNAAAGSTITTAAAPGASVTTRTNSNGTASTTTQQAPNGVEVEVGIVSRIAGASANGYSVNNGTLSLTNLGRTTPQLLTGLGFSCNTSTATTTTTGSAGNAAVSKAPLPTSRFCSSWAKTVGAFAAVQMGSGTNQTITGYSLGVTFAINSHLRILTGFSLSPTSQIAPGFVNTVTQYVTKNPSLFPSINPANLAANAPGAFDGIQTTTTAPAAGAAPTSIVYYPGSLTKTNYKAGFIIGIALPINVFNLIGGNNKNN